MQPIEALAHMSGRLGAARDELPSDVEDAAARYQVLLAGHRMLVVLPISAAHTEQVRQSLESLAAKA